MLNTWLTKTFDLKYPIIMAPMFLISNKKMLVEAANAGIMGCVPALNYWNPDDFAEAMKDIKNDIKGPFGVNLVANKSNMYLKRQIDICLKHKPDFIITSLGSPETIIKACKPEGIKVICDVVDLQYAKKIEELGADAVIAVNSGAGGHAGPIPTSILVPLLRESCNIPVISAGGVGEGSALLSALSLGAEGVSIGSPFIATKESPVGQPYKDAVIKYGATDIGMTTRLTGTPCTVIKTPYVMKKGLQQGRVELFLHKNLKKWAKLATYYRGKNLLTKAAFSATYKSVWCAGPSIEFVKKSESVKETVERLVDGYQDAYNRLVGRPS